MGNIGPTFIVPPYAAWSHERLEMESVSLDTMIQLKSGATGDIMWLQLYGKWGCLAYHTYIGGHPSPLLNHKNPSFLTYTPTLAHISSTVT